MPIQTLCTCSMSLTGFCSKDIRECKELFLNEMDNCYQMEEKKYQNCPICGTPCEVIGEPYQGDKPVEELWELFWKPIVSNEDGTINIEQVKKELADFSFIMEQVPKVYCHITKDMMSKVMYKAEDVIRMADDHFNEALREAIKEEREGSGAAWIKADTKPEHNVGVLVFIPGEDNHITSGMWDIDNKWVLLDEYRVPDCEVTHWMELPSFPDGYTANEISSELCAAIKEIAKEELKQSKEGNAPLTQSRADLIREANNRDLGGVAAAGREEDAVGFAEWCGWDWRRVEGKSLWENQKTLEVMKTAQLYELFKQNEKP